MITLTLLIIATLFLAYSNGANDNFKGVATLFGSGTTSYRAAITWATISTLAGSITSLFLAGTLLKNFSGRGLVPNDLAASPQFVLAVGLGAGLTVMLATLTGFPVSTTHGLVGALVGAGLTAAGANVNFATLGTLFFLHVSVGSLFGIGLITREANARVVSGILLSWVLTLPIAAVLSAALYAITTLAS